MGSAHPESSAGHGLEDSDLHSSTDDWDAVRYRCDYITSGWEGSRSHGEGYVQLEEEQEEEEEGEGEEEGDGEDTDRLVGQLQIQGRRLTISTQSGRKMHSGYGSLADGRKT